MMTLTVTLTSVILCLAAAQEIKINVNPTIETVTSPSWVSAPPASVNSSVCYRYVGCYNTYPPYDNTGGVLPNPLARIGTVFLLYTNKKPNTGQQMDYKDQGVSLDKTDFNPMYPTKFVIHGFTQNEKEKWVHEMKDALLSTGPLNVIIVGWGGGAAAPDYPKAVANTRVVGMQVKLLIDLMVKKGMELDRIHLIGHSLGAHVSGYAGRDLGGKIGRISGMDPAGPLYEGKDVLVRLDPTDAVFVDVIHSNAKPLVDMGAGMYQACGHVDFYPNGGQEQPGCPNPLTGAIGKLLTFNLNGAEGAVTCSHSRSHYYFMESLLSMGCRFLAHPCSNWDDYENGKCNSCGQHGCSELGYHSIEYAARGNFYLMTKGFSTAKAPDGEQFCGVTYDITITPGKDSPDVKGKINLKIKGTNDQIVTPFQSEKDVLGKESKIIIVDYHELGEPQSIDLSYEKYGGWSFLSIGAGPDKWNIDHLELEHKDSKYKFCASGSQVNTGKTMTLARC